MTVTSAVLDAFETGASETHRKKHPPGVPKGAKAAGSVHVLPAWVRAQSVNLRRHAAALRPFHEGEFGTGASAPTRGHLKAVNDLIEQLRGELLKMTAMVTKTAAAAEKRPDPAHLERLVTLSEHAHHLVRAIEKVWDFYLEFFGQRTSRFADWLAGCDRIALDCYQYAYLGLGTARTVPTPAPMSYMRTGFSPATHRRHIPVQRLGQLNPFPIIELPYHRLVNPWTLGAILHEVSHNLQNDLGLQDVVPKAIGHRLREAGLPRPLVETWVRWNRETFADMSGTLLGGPTIVGSLIDILARSPRTVTHFSPTAVHPLPILRTLLSTELLRRMGFSSEAKQYQSVWTRIYAPHFGRVPARLQSTFSKVCPLVVDTICYQPYATLGNRRLADVLRFEAKEQSMIEEAAVRLAAGVDPGIIPERFLIGAARIAFDRQLARPGVIVDHFYKQLARQ